MEPIRRALAQYYPFMFTKIADHGTGSIYAAEIHCQLCKDHRYVIMVAYANNYPVGSTTWVDQIPWFNLQTRTVEDDYNLKSVHHERPRVDLLQEKIKEHKVTQEGSYYFCQNLPITVGMLNDPRTNSKYQWASEMKLAQALETYHCTITFNVKNDSL